MLKIENLTAGYDEKFQLRDINFKIKPREIFGIIGPNGSGKTTLLRVITKVIKPQKGKIIFNGEDIKNIPINELAKKVAVVSQNQHLGFDMTVKEFVFLGRIPHRKRFQFFETPADEKIAEEAMNFVDIVKLKEKFLTELSGGERQLVFIARALCQQPELLLLDEPTTHLDIAHQIQVLNLVKKLNREFGLTVIIVLHDLNLASEYCDRLLLMNNGFIHKIGSPEEVLTYQTIEEVYKTVVLVKESPISKKPYVFLVPEISKDS